MEYTQLYARYCFSVSNNQEKALQIRREMREVLKDLTLTKYTPDSSIFERENCQLILTISAALDGQNMITNCGSQAKKLLKYDKYELIGNELSLIQEDAFRDSHNHGF